MGMVEALASALPARDALKKVFASIMMTVDKWYRVGERIVVTGYDGVVEEVGLRSTTIEWAVDRAGEILDDHGRVNSGLPPHVYFSDD